MADQNNISDLEKEYEAKINAVVANEAYKASIEDSPNSDSSLGGTIDISNLLASSKVLTKIADSFSKIKETAKNSPFGKAYESTKEKQRYSGLSADEKKYIADLISSKSKSTNPEIQSSKEKTASQLDNISSYIKNERTDVYSKLRPKKFQEKLEHVPSAAEYIRAAVNLNKVGINKLNSRTVASEFLKTQEERSHPNVRNTYEYIKKRFENTMASKGDFNFLKTYKQELEKELKPIFAMIAENFSKTAEKITEKLKSVGSGIKDSAGPIFSNVKKGAKNYIRYENVNWGRFGGTTKRNYKDWKQNVINRSNAANMYDGTFRGLVNSTGLNFAKSITRTILPFGKAEKFIPMLGVGAELLKKGAQKLYEAGVEGLKAFGEIQAIQTNLGVVYGNQSEADQMFDKLSAYAVKSPFSTSQIANFAVLLKQSGVYSSDVESTLKMLGDTAGGNEEKMSRIANNYAQIVAMGKATSMDLRQFANANIPIYEELKKQLGNISQKELRQITAQGGITSDIIEKAFRSMTSEGGRFANATEKGAETYKARKTNLADIKQLGMSEWGELVYNYSPTKVLMDLQEMWYSSLKSGANFFNNQYDNKQIDKAYKNYEGLTNLYDALKSQTEATSSNTKALTENSLNRLKGASESSYRAYIDKARAAGTSAYLSKSEPAREKSEKLNYVLDILNNIDEKQFKEILSQDFFQNLLSEIGLFSSTREGHSRESLINMLQDTMTKKIDYQLKAAKDANGGKDYKRYLQSQGISLARDASEEFGRFSKNKNSSTSVDADMYELYKQTEAYKEEEFQKEQERLKEARKLLEIQKKLGINENDFSWIKNNQSLDTADIAKNLKTFYGYNYLDTASENLTDKTKGIISDNLSNIGSRLESTFLGLDQQVIIGLNKELKEALEEKPDSVSAKNANSEKINNIAGKYKEFAETLKDETQKTLLNAIFIDSKSTLIDEKQLEAVEKNTKKETKKTFTAFWKRYAASILDISTDGLSSLSVSAQVKDENARAMNQSISLAMMSSGYNPEEALKMISYGKPEIRTGGTSGSRGVNQAATAKTYEEFAMSAQATAEVTSAYLQELQRQESQLQQFFSGAAFKREDLDKLYDPEWASQLGYTNKESWVNAFDAMTDASGKFTEATLSSVSAIYTEIKKRKENASVLSGFKNENATLEDKLNAEKSRSFISNLYYPDSEQFQKFDSLPKSDKDAYFSILQKVYADNKANGTERMQKDVSGFFTGSMLDDNENIVTAKKNLSEANKNLEQAKNNLAKSKEVLDNTPKYESPKKKNFIEKAKDWVTGSKDELPENPSYAEAKAKFESAQAEVNAAQVVVNTATTNLENETKAATGIDAEVYKEQDSYIDKVGEYNQIKQTQALREMPGWKDLAKEAEYTQQDNPWFRMFHEPIDVAEGNTYRQQKLLNAYGAEQGTKFKDYVKARYTEELPDGTLTAGGENTQTYENLMQAKEMLSGMGEEGKALADSLDFNNLDLSSLEKMEEIIGSSKKQSKDLKDKVTQVFDSVKESAKSSALSAIQNSWTAIGESIATSESATEGIAAAWKDAARQLLSSISATLTKAGLELVIAGAQEHNKAEIFAGLAMAAAGGVAGISAGMLGASSSSDDSTEENNYEDKIRNLKDALSDLIDQAKTDAEYYQKNLLHKQALSENDYYSSKSISVNDAIITPNGNVISTAPDDYLIATKTPDTLMGSNTQRGGDSLQIEFNPTFNFIDQTSQGVQAEVEEKQDEDGNISFDVILKNVVGEAIANGDLDGSFNAREYRLRGKSVAW